MFACIAVELTSPAHTTSMNPSFRLTLSVVAIVVLWQVPGGAQILYPFSLLATLAHELGHGLTALAVGAEFESLSIHADGSGLARWRGNPGPLATAAIAAGGLVGPSIAGVTLLWASSSPRYVRRVLAVLAILAVLVVLLWVRNPFGVMVVLGAAVTTLIASRFLGDGAAALLLNLVAVTLCLSLFKDINYMFSAVAVVDGVARVSDSGAIAEALWLPYWFWGAVVSAFSLTVLVLGVWLTSRSKEHSAHATNEHNSA